MENNVRLAHEIMKYVGGEKNIASINHCSTRLRFRLNDDQKINVEELKKISGVLGVVKAIGGYQIIIGNHVSKVYQAIINNYHIESAGQQGRIAANPFEMLMNTLSDIMGPAIPAVVAAGLITALATICTFLGLSKDSSTYAFLNAIGQAPFYFLPFIVAYTSAKHWKLNPVMTLFLAGIMFYPSVMAMVDTGPISTLFGLPVTNVNYSSSLIPMILTVWVMSYINRFIEKYCPDAIRYVMVPFLTIVLMVPIMLCITGPIGSWIGQLISLLVRFLHQTVPGLTVIVVGALSPLMVLTGSHLALLPILMEEFNHPGYDIIMFVAFIGMNFSQFAVSLAVFLKAKSKTLKSTAFSTGLTAFLTGTTEPALYGLTVRLKKPLIATFIGCVANGIFCAIFGVKWFAFGAPGFFTMVNAVDPTGLYPNNIYFAIGGAIVTIIVTFLMTYILGFDETEYIEKEQQSLSPVSDAVIVSPMQGELIALEDLQDEVFSKKMLGDGVAIIPSSGKVYAPITGTITALPQTNHAIGITSDTGLEMLIHIGLDSEKITNEFQTKLHVGDHVNQGELLVEFQIQKLKNQGYRLESPIIILNGTNSHSMIKVNKQSIRVGENLFAMI